MTPLLDLDAVGIAGRIAPTTVRIDAGTMVALVGPNGGGKTSLLRAIAGVDDASGSVRIDGEPLAAAAPNRRAKLVGFLPATREVAWPIPVRDVVELGHGDMRAAADAIELLELAVLADARVDRLSTGERARVLLARIIAADPRLMLLDEPLSNFDPYWVLRTLDLLGERVRRERTAAIVSLHDLHQAHRFDRLIAVAHGQVNFHGDPKEFMESSALRAVFNVTRERESFVL